MNVKPLEQLAYADFAKAVKAKFRVWVDAKNWVDLVLSEATPPHITMTGGAKNEAYENFALFFMGPADQLLPQKIYGFESTALGRFELFIVPVDHTADGIQYQATFNRLQKPA